MATDKKKQNSEKKSEAYLEAVKRVADFELRQEILRQEKSWQQKKTN